MLLDYDTADFNGRHGIILAENVTDSVVQHGTATGNGQNGIMIEESSAGNVIKNNLVTGNASDGVVVAGSGGTLVAGNSVSGNQVGIAVRGPAPGTKIIGNTITANKMAAQGASLAQNTVYGNGGGWLPRRVGEIWLCALALLGFLLGITRAMQPRRSRHVRVTTALAQVKEPR
jgi:parallel beta-helix repeat protein